MKNTIYNVNSDNSCTMNISTQSMKDRTDKTKDSLSIANLQLGEANYPLSIIHCQLSILTALLIVFCLLFGGRAFAETLTVYEDGASTNYYVPMFVFYFDDFSRAQTVFPAEDLAEMAGGTITSITFYTTNSNIPYTAVSSADIYLTEVGSTSISAYVDKSSAQTVCSGYFNFVSDGNGGGMVTITLSTPYIYQGGNLLFGCDNTEDIGYKQIIFKGKTASGASISGYNSSSTGTISVNSRNFLPKTTFTYTPGAAPSCPILTIANATQWNAFAQCVADGNNYSGQTVTLTNDISVTTMVGNSSHPFSGTFEGNGKTITVNISSSDQGAAPFRYISGATIQNLKVEGTVTSTAHHASGLVGFCTDGSTNTIRNCLVSTNVTNNNNYDGDNGNNYIGGIIGHNLSSTTSIIGCVYNGTLTSQGFKGGMVGFGNYNSNVTITDSYFAGAYSANGYSNPNFSPISCHGAGRNFIFTFSNFYYNTDAGTFTAPSYEGTENATYNGAGRAMHAYSVIGITPVTVAMNGTPTRTYNVSGIDVYATGIVFDNTIYAASGASLSLNLDGSDRGYLSDHGTLTGSANPYTLAMDAYNTKIAINCLVTSFPWEEDFEGFSASSSGVKLEDPCWVNEHIEGTGTYFFEVYSGTNGTNSTKQVRLRDMYSGTKTKLMLPPMDFGGVAYQFSLDVFRNATGTNYGEGVRVYASTDGNIEGATELAFISRSYQTSDGNLIPAESASGWYRYELILPHTGTCYIILRGESQYGSSTYMDNFRVELAPTCPKPTGLSVNPDGLSAILNWSGSSDSFDVACSTSSSADPSSNIVETGIQENTYTKNNLTIDNDYYFWVRANCGGEGYSTWTGPVSVHIGYCKPNPTSVDGKGITTLTFGSGDYTVNNSNSNGLPASSPYYADYTSMVGGYEQGETATVTITYSTGNYTVYSYGTIIWVDWNKNYTFEDSEIVYTGTSAQGSNGTPQVLTATFSIPANQAGGDYCMRIAGADSYFDSYIGGSASANHDPCFTSTYAVCHDYTLRVISSTPTITATANPAAGGTVTFMAGPANSNAASTHLPLDSFRNNSFSQQIYTPEEIGGGSINSISLYSIGGNLNEDNIIYTRNLDVYLAHTNKAEFSSTTDWISNSDSPDMVKVYSGSVTFNCEEWNTINFTTTFNYDGTRNLLLVIADNTNASAEIGNYLECKAFTPSSGGNCSLNYGWGQFNPSSPSGNGELLTVKNQILVNGSSTRTFPQGASCTLVATANANYNFDNWTEGSTELSTNEVYTVSNITADHTIVGNFSLPTFTLTTSVNTSGGGAITCSPSSANGVYTYGTVVTLTANAATGYTFQNWTVDGVTVSGSPTSVTMTADHNVVANFTINTYTVTYNANGGSGTMSNTSGQYNTSVPLSSNGFTAPAGKTFDSWNTNPSGTGTSYTEGQSYTITGNITLYAQWVDIPRTVTISAPGVVCTSSETVLEVTNVTGFANPQYTWSASPSAGAGLPDNVHTSTITVTPDAGNYTYTCEVTEEGSSIPYSLGDGLFTDSNGDLAASGTACYVMSISGNTFTVLNAGLCGGPHYADAYVNTTGMSGVEASAALMPINTVSNMIYYLSENHSAKGWYIPSASEIQSFVSTDAGRNVFLTESNFNYPAPHFTSTVSSEGSVTVYGVTRPNGTPTEVYSSTVNYTSSGPGAFLAKSFIYNGVSSSVTIKVHQGATIEDFPVADFSNCGAYEISPNISDAACSDVSWEWGGLASGSGNTATVDSYEAAASGTYTLSVTKSTLKQYDMITQNGIAAIVVVVPTMTNDGKAVPIGTGGIGANATAGNVADGALTNLQEAIRVNGGETYSGNREGFVIPAGAAGGVCQSTASVSVAIDNTAPELTGLWPSNITDQDNCMASRDISGLLSNDEAAALYTDDNGGAITVTSTDEVSGDDCSWTVTRTYTIKDACDNTVDPAPVMSVSGSDQTAPSIVGSLPTKNVEGCSATLTTLYPAKTTVAALEAEATALGGSLDISDNCTADANLTVSSSETSSGTCPIVVTRKYTITDACGKFSKFYQTINVNVANNITITGGTNARTVSCVSEVVPPHTITPSVMPTVKDACGTVLSYTSSSPVISNTPSTINCEGIRTYTYTYQDCVGHTATWTYTYTIDHSTAPSEVGGPVATSSTVECATAATAPTALPLVKDVCGNTLAAPTPVVSGTYTDCEGTKIYTYTYEDCAGLQYVWTYTYTIERADFMMPLDEGSTITCASQLAEPILPEVTDNCGNVLTGVLKAGYPTATPQCDGEVEYVYTFTDCAGNAHDWTYTYTIERNIVPELTGTWPDNITGQDNCFANANVNVLLSNEDAAALYSSNCGGNVTATHNDVNTLVSDCGWTITRTYTITDGCTETTNVQSVSGSDQTAPAITNTNLNRELISTNCTFIVPNLTEEVRNIASDNCTAQGDLVITQDITPGTEITNATTVTVTVTDLCGNSSTKSIQLTLPELLTASLSAEAILCNDGTVDIINTVEGGTADYTFVWNTDATSQNLTGVHAGTYSVTVTDANGCTAVPTITISEPTALTTSLSTEAVSCNGGNDGSITVSVSGGTPEAGDMYYYSNDGGTSWTDASVSPYVFAGLTAGNYDIAVKDKNGCIKNCGVMEVTQPDVFAAGSIAGADTTICCGLTPNTIRNLALPSGGDGSYTYQWQYSTDAGSSWIDISSNTTTYVPEEIYVTTWFRRQVKDATCQTEFTESDNIYKVTVSTPSVTGISDGDFVWSGNADATNWSNAGNWLVYNATTSMYSAAGSQPTTSDNVYLVTYGDGCSVGNPTLTAASFANNLTIGAGKSISLGDYNLTLAESLNNEGTFNGNAGTLSLAGDLNNNGIFNSQTSEVVFSGTSQTISNSATLELYDVHFNQSQVGTITAPNGITVNNQATFTQGVVLGDMIFVDGASASGANLASYVDGLVTKKGNGLFTFPTGSHGVLGTIEATVVNNTDEGIKARFNNASADGHGYTTEAPDNYPRWWNINDMCGDDNENRFDHVSNFEYWKVEGISGDTKLTSPTLKVDATTAGAHFHDGSQQNAEAINAAAHYDCWKNMGGSANVENGGNTITISGMNDIKYTRSGAFDGIITLGSVAENVVLPIELLSFTATCDGKSALVEWTTATERNNDYFVLERSDDAINFTEVARVAGAGNSIDPIDYSYTDYGIHGGDNYYRLVQVDYDGTRAVSEVVVVNCIETAAGEPDVQAYPNPFDGELTLELENFDNRPARIDVYDMLGKLIYTDKVASPQNYYETILNLSNLPPATYTVRVSTADFVINKKVVKQ